jgi:hypothetical protein
MANSLCQSCLAYVLSEFGLISKFRADIEPGDVIKFYPVVSELSRYFKGTLDAETANQVTEQLAKAMDRKGFNPDYHETWVSNVERGMYTHAMALE